MNQMIKTLNSFFENSVGITRILFFTFFLLFSFHSNAECDKEHLSCYDHLFRINVTASGDVMFQLLSHANRSPSHAQLSQVCDKRGWFKVRPNSPAKSEILTRLMTIQASNRKLFVNVSPTDCFVKSVSTAPWLDDQGLRKVTIVDSLPERQPTQVAVSPASNPTPIHVAQTVTPTVRKWVTVGNGAFNPDVCAPYKIIGCASGELRVSGLDIPYIFGIRKEDGRGPGNQIEIRNHLSYCLTPGDRRIYRLEDRTVAYLCSNEGAGISIVNKGNFPTYDHSLDR